LSGGVEGGTDCSGSKTQGRKKFREDQKLTFWGGEFGTKLRGTPRIRVRGYQAECQKGASRIRGRRERACGFGVRGKERRKKGVRNSFLGRKLRRQASSSVVRETRWFTSEKKVERKTMERLPRREGKKFLKGRLKVGNKSVRDYDSVFQKGKRKGRKKEKAYRIWEGWRSG